MDLAWTSIRYPSFQQRLTGILKTADSQSSSSSAQFACLLSYLYYIITNIIAHSNSSSDHERPLSSATDYPDRLHTACKHRVFNQIPEEAEARARQDATRDQQDIRATFKPTRGRDARSQSR